MKKGFFAAIAAAALLLLQPVTTVNAANSPDGTIVIEKKEGNGGISTGMSAKEVDAAWGTSIAKDYGENLTVLYVGDAYVSNANAKNVPDRKVAASELAAGGTVIAHKGKSLQVGKSITLKASDLSPVIVLGSTENGGGSTEPGNTTPADKTPKTGDSTGLWTGALLISLITACAAMKMKHSRA